MGVCPNDQARMSECLDVLETRQRMRYGSAMPTELKGAPLPGGRIRAIDWLRGLSVLFMIECHTLWFLTPSLEYTPRWIWIQNLNGLVSAAFLFASGFAGGLVGSRAAGDRAARIRRGKRTFARLGEVVALAAYFHLACFPVFTHPATWLRVDILTCIAFGVVAVWGAVAACRGKIPLTVGVLLALAAAIVTLTPWASRYRGGEVLTGWLNASNGSMFPLFPWLLYPLLGAVMGIAAGHPQRGRARLLGALAAMFLIGGTLSLSTWGEQFWTRFPADGGIFWVRNAFERLWKLGLLCMVLATLEMLAAPMSHWSWTRVFRPVETVANFFSRYALPAYFVHLALIYGFLGLQFTRQWHRQSTWRQYTWRMLLVVIGTAAICHLLHLARRTITDALRALTAEPPPPHLAADAA